MLERFDTYWSGDRWRLWALVSGVVSVPLTVLLASIIALISGERLVPLILLILVAIILVASLIGSGIIDTLSSQLNRGGLARETTDDVDKALETGESEENMRRGQEQEDRRTIRAGLFVIAPIVAFVYFMTVV